MRHGKLPSDPEELSCVTKAAILLLSLEHESSTAMLK